MNKHTQGILLCAFVFLSGCPRTEGLNASSARVFFQQSTADQLKTFRQHPLEHQLGLFFFGNQVRHPPAIYLARCFALNGTPAVELLRSELKEDTDDLTVRDIALLLATIDEMGKYDVAADLQLMDKLTTRVAQMRDAGWRDTAERQIASIGNDRSERSGNAPECGQN